MATLVLTAIGGALGGPIGAGLGALLGQAADARLLGSGGSRTGPRLSELKVQTSSYGSDLPKLFGTMRVAGTVIWATDLIESRSTSGGGKGRPSTTTYSYSASFAVALSARAIVSVGRIWADGNLLRGEAGDWKSVTGFRLHLGGEDQAVDPLIASAEGAGLAPAHRGLAYAVFEGLELADFGNRIPSLTFEVAADAGAVTPGAAIAQLSPVAAGGGGSMGGYSAYGESLRASIAPLVSASGGWISADGDGGLVLVDDGAPEFEVADAGAADAAVRSRALTAVDMLPRAVSLSYYDPARDFQAGVQRAARSGGGRDQRIELPAALDAGVAKQMASAMLARAWIERETRTVKTSAAAIGIGLGALVSITGESGRWRVAKAEIEGLAVSLELKRVASEAIVSGGSPGRVLGAPDAPVGETLVQAFELPGLTDALLDRPRLLIAATGTGAGWRRASLLLSQDGGISWSGIGVTGAPAVLGLVTAAPGAAPATMMDLTNHVDVQLAREDMVLGAADSAALDAGANLALIGNELIQFGAAAPLGGGGWRLTKLLRGRRGTEASSAAAGDPFILVEAAALAFADLPVSMLGGAAQVLASGVGDAAGVEADALISGRSVLPPSPVHLTVERAEDGAGILRWVRRSRLGWRWIDGVDAPIAEEREAYRVSVGERVTETVEPQAALTADEMSGGPLTLSVRQIGTNGLSLPATIIIEP